MLHSSSYPKQWTNNHKCFIELVKIYTSNHFFSEIGRSVLAHPRHKCASRCAAAPCCTGCPRESPGTFIKTCCLKREVLVHVWGFGFFSFGYVLKLTMVPVQPELCVSSTPQGHFCVTQIWAGVCSLAFPLASPTVPACTREWGPCSWCSSHV